MAELDLITLEDLQNEIRALETRIAKRLDNLGATEDGWLDSRAAAEYVAMTINAFYKISNQIRSCQFEENGKMRFRKSWLNEYIEKGIIEPVDG